MDAVYYDDVIVQDVTPRYRLFYITRRDPTTPQKFILWARTLEHLEDP